MSQFFQIHSDNPQLRLIAKAAQIIHGGSIIALPTDSCYALVCHLDDKDAVTRLRRIRNVDDKHHLTLLCRDLSEIANYERVYNQQYRMLKAATPGPYTLILEATKEVPRRIIHPSRKTIGLRVPENTIAQALLAELAQALLGTTLIMPNEDQPLTDPDEVRDRLAKLVELVIDGGTCSFEPTTVIDMTGTHPKLRRQGRGDASVFGL